MPHNHQDRGILDTGEWKEVKKDCLVEPRWKKPDWKWKPVSRPAKHYFCRVRSLVWPKSRPPEKLRPTSYLDGLRGFAALLVYWQHHELWSHESSSQTSVFEDGLGHDGKYAFCAVPGFRIFFTGGHYAVAVFFVISGYVLSAKPLAHIHAGEQAKLADNLGSALFRRWMRLYIPLICTTFLYMLSWHLFGGIPVLGTEPQGNLRDEIWHWYAEFKNFSFIFTRGGEPWLSYNFHTWSIPIEMKGSIIIYTALLAFSRFSTNTRLWCTVALAFYFLYIADGWYGATFLAGMLLRDLDGLSSRGELPSLFTRLERHKRFICYHLLLASIYLGGIPASTLDVENLRKTRGWYYLSLLKPQAVFDYKWFYLFWAAIFLVIAVPRLPWLKRFFESRFCQHLGRISYALYLTHGPLLWVLGDKVYAAVGWHREWHTVHTPWLVDKLKLPRVGPLGLEFSFLAPHIILLPLSLWVAELATRAFDEPAVKFAGWLYRKMQAKPGVQLGKP
jgi:peptidoglycan/LPS O-acetylase OafA/YrhL